MIQNNSEVIRASLTAAEALNASDYFSSWPGFTRGFELWWEMIVETLRLWQCLLVGQALCVCVSVCVCGAAEELTDNVTLGDGSINGLLNA